MLIIAFLYYTIVPVPVPKKKRVHELNDLRPIALTSQIMKCFERTILEPLALQVCPFQDPLQFAYRKKVGVDDALLYMLQSTYSHLESVASSVRIMFFDFSSAFNTIQPHLLASKLMNFNLHSSTIAWVMDYLISRPQFVRLNNLVSDTILTRTGAPQGTVLSSFWFTLYTADCRHSQVGCHLQKFSDDSALVGLISNGNDQAYRDEINRFVSWCEENYLDLNLSKTKELVIDFRKKKAMATPIFIKGSQVEIVPSYKYLGVHLDKDLNWKENTNAVVKKAQSRMFFLRKLRSFGVSRTLMNIFYQSILASILFYAVVCWGNSITVDDRNRIKKLLKKAGSIIGIAPESLETTMGKRMEKKLDAIFNNNEHPLYGVMISLRSNFSGRLLMPRCSTERFRRSFVPSAVKFFTSR